MTPDLTLISSMATRTLLAELLPLYEAHSGQAVRATAVGGVDAAKRILAGEAFDGVMLAASAIDQLTAAGRVRAGSRVDVVCSGVALAVRAGAPAPPIGDEMAVRAAVLAAESVSYSTGPSGVHLQRLFERWGIAAAVQGRLVQAPPGVPVGTLVAEGRVALGFQQLSELLHVPGITVIGPLPPSIQLMTVFAAGVCEASTQPDAAQRLLDFLADARHDERKRRHGMQAA